MRTKTGLDWGGGEYLRSDMGKEGQRAREQAWEQFSYLVNKYLLSAYSVQVIF